jgi:hypothetical protein
MYKWDAVEALRLIEKHKVTDKTGVPTMSAEVLQAHKDNPEIDISSLKGLGSGGAARPPEPNPFRLEMSISGLSLCACRTSADIVGTPVLSVTLCFSIRRKASTASHLYIKTIFLAVTKDYIKTA